MSTSERISLLRRLVGDVEKRFRDQKVKPGAGGAKGLAPKPVGPLGLDPESGFGPASDPASLDERKNTFLTGEGFQEEETSRGAVMVRSRLVDDRTARFGDVPLAGLRQADMKSLAVLAGDERLAEVTPGDLLFLDIETTSLALGTGTCVFLTGLAYLGPNGIVVEQLFAREPAEEAAKLELLAERIKQAGALVTFNGKAFDLDVLQTRYLMNRRRLKLKAMPHADLLHISRRLYRNCCSSFRLQALEEAVLGCPRDQSEDIPGEQIPEAYFDFIKRGRTGIMRPVLNHNYSDVLAMCALLIKCASFSGAAGWEEADGQLYWNLGRYLDRAGRRDESLEFTMKALEAKLSAGERREAMFTLSLNFKRAGRHEEAESIWRTMHDGGDVRGTIELCKHLEHRAGDFAAALQLVEKLLTSGFPEAGELNDDLQRRVHRLKCRLAGKRWY